jgi:hypothetical protein
MNFGLSKWASHKDVNKEEAKRRESLPKGWLLRRVEAREYKLR